MNNNGSNMFDTLIIIGNGFDIWQGLDTSYSSFRSFYYSHRDELMKELDMAYYYADENDFISDVELIYGNPFEFKELDNDFWNSFESSLDKIDSWMINIFFGKDDDDLDDMQVSMNNAQNLLRKMFIKWVSTVEVVKKDSGYLFGENCYCINFNYTDTVEKRFGTSNVFHIHGINKSGNLVFGHSSHPQRPLNELAEIGGRFGGLYIVENLLYQTDKKTFNNILNMRLNFAIHNVKFDQIKNIYVVGHSFGDADIDYFQYIMKETSVVSESEKQTEIWDEVDPFEEFQLRMQYVINKYGENRDVSKIEHDTVQRRLQFEHACDEKDFLDALNTCFPALKKKEKCKTDAHWHITYYSERDKERILKVMHDINCRNYTLYNSVEDCLACFKIN